MDKLHQHSVKLPTSVLVQTSSQPNWQTAASHPTAADQAEIWAKPDDRWQIGTCIGALFETISIKQVLEAV